MRPEQAILGLRKELGLFANLRPATLFKGLEDAAALRPEVARDIDMVILRELTGDVYFGEKGLRTTGEGLRQGYDVMAYDEAEVSRNAIVGFEMAMGPQKRPHSVDKTNVLETSQFWLAMVSELGGQWVRERGVHYMVNLDGAVCSKKKKN